MSTPGDIQKMHSTVRSTLLSAAVGIAAVLLVVGCQAFTPPPASGAATHVIDLDARDFSYVAPDTLPSGLVTLRMTNHGQEVHHVQLLRLKDTTTFEQFVAALQTEGDGAIGLTTLPGGVGPIDPQATAEVTLNLDPGAYVLACFIAGPDGVPHVAKGMILPLQVVQPAEPATTATPTTRGTFQMSDFSFEMPDSLPAGRNTFQVVNAGPQFHELNVVRLAPGASVQDVLAWTTQPSGPPPFEAVGGMNGLSVGGVGYMTLDLPVGSYVAICHIPDPNTGLPHAQLGMLKAFAVKG
jgi:hypothetical protein